MSVISLFQICIYCQSICKPKYPICDFCKTQLFSRLKYSFCYNDDGFKIHSLHDWHPNQDDFLSHIISNSKKVSTDNFWNLFAKMLVDSIDKKIDLFIPSPAKNHLTLDHAARLTLAIEKEYNSKHVNTSASVLFCLKKKTKTAQKLLTKQQRVSVQTELVPFNQPCKKVNNIMFVDDVITTGNTAKSCINSLKTIFPNAEFEIAVISRRLLDPKLIKC